jgi:hypothetical protein
MRSSTAATCSADWTSYWRSKEVVAAATERAGWLEAARPVIDTGTGGAARGAGGEAGHRKIEAARLESF